MANEFGPKNELEREAFAVEEFRFDVQYAIQSVMVEKGVSRTELAERLDCKPSWVSQLLREESNPTLETVARVFYALGDAPRISSAFLDERQIFCEIKKFEEEISSTKRKHLASWQEGEALRGDNKERGLANASSGRHVAAEVDSMLHRVMAMCTDDKSASRARSPWHANKNVRELELEMA